MTCHLFEVIGHSHKIFKSYVARLEDSLWIITNPDQHLALITFKCCPMTAPRPFRDQPMICDLILDSIEIYLDAKVLISHYVRIDETTRLCNTASEQPQTSKRGKFGLLHTKTRHLHRASKDQALALHALTMFLALICQANKNCDFWKDPRRMKTPEENAMQLGIVTTNKTYGHHTDDCKMLKYFL